MTTAPDPFDEALRRIEAAGGVSFQFQQALFDHAMRRFDELVALATQPTPERPEPGYRINCDLGDQQPERHSANPHHNADRQQSEPGELKWL